MVHFLIWLNLPAKRKLVNPHFKNLWADSILEHVETDRDGKKTFIDIYFGAYKSKQGPKPTPDSCTAEPNNQVIILTIKMEANAQLVLPLLQKV